MSANLIPVITRALGLQIGEEFKLENYGSKCRFTVDNLQIYNVYGPEEVCGWVDLPRETLCDLITGRIKIEKSSFNIPTYGVPYWTYKHIKEDPKGWYPRRILWDGFEADYLRLASGCVFLTREEAIAARPAKYKEITGKEWREDD